MRYTILITATGVAIGFALGLLVCGARHTHSDSSCKDCREMWERGYEWGCRDSTVTWEDWK